MQKPNYADVMLGFIFSMHSRRFALSIVTMFIMYQGGRAGLSNEVLAIIGGVASSFILGESYNDGKKSEAAALPETINATGGDVNVGSTPRPADAIDEAIEWRDEMPGDVPQGYGAPNVPREPVVEPLPSAPPLADLGEDTSDAILKAAG